MTFRDVLGAAALSLVLIACLAAGAFALVAASIAFADHRAIGRAIADAPSQDFGVPALDVRLLGWREGYFPECAGASLLLSDGVASSPADAAIRAEVIQPPPERTICVELQRVLRGEDGVSWFTYARYWHGFLILHRTVLSVADYATLKQVAGALVWLAALAAFAAIAWRTHWRIAGALMAPVILLTDMAVIGALPVQAMCFAALFAATALFATAGINRTARGALVVAALSGALYNFLDFLTNPECLAALCAWLWGACAMLRGETVRARDLVLVFLAVIGGFAGMWAAKWALAFGYSALGGQVYLFNGGDLTRWAPGSGDWWPGQATVSTIATMIDRSWKLVIAGLFIAAIAAFAWRHRVAPGPVALLLTPVLLAWLFDEAKSGHTIAHAAIVFRLAPLTLGLVAASVLVVQMMPAARKPAIAPAS